MDYFQSNYTPQELANYSSKRKAQALAPDREIMTEKDWKTQLDATAHYLLNLSDEDKIWQLERYLQDMKHLPNYLLDQLYFVLFQYMLDYERKDFPQKDKNDPLYSAYLELFKKTRMVKLERLRNRSQTNTQQLNLARHYSQNYKEWT